MGLLGGRPNTGEKKGSPGIRKANGGCLKPYEVSGYPFWASLESIKRINEGKKKIRGGENRIRRS